jgi:hypothetical protein
VTYSDRLVIPPQTPSLSGWSSLPRRPPSSGSPSPGQMTSTADTLNSALS